MTVDKVKQFLQEVEEGKNVAIIDVRTKEEYKEKHLDQTKNIPLDQLLFSKDELLGYEKVLFLCAHGQRSYQAFSVLEALGHPQVEHSDICIEDWEKHNLIINKRLLAN